MNFRHLGSSEGLSQGVITSILQDRQGFMWFGTNDGLNRYDGYKFKVYKYDPSDSNSISGNYVQALFEAKNGLIWIGTYDGGLNSFDPMSGKFKHYMYSAKDSLSIKNNDVRTITEGKDGLIYAGNFGGGLNVLDPKSGKFKRYRYSKKDTVSFPLTGVWFTMCDKQGDLWVSGWGKKPGTYKWDLRKNKLEFVDPIVAHKILETSNGQVWMGSYWANVCVYDPVTKITKPIEFTKNKKDHIYGVISIYEDSFGKIWLGNSIVYDPKTELCFQYKGIDVARSTSVFHDRAGVVWIGTGDVSSSGQGLYVSDKNREKFFYYRHDPNNVNSLEGNDVRAIYKDNGGKLYIGGDGAGIDVYDEKTGEKIANYKGGNNKIRAFQENNDTGFWVGQRGAGISCFNSQNGKFIYDFHKPREGVNLGSGEVISLTRGAKSGLLWMGTLGGGFSSYDQTKDVFTNYTYAEKKSNTVSNNGVQAVVEDSQGIVWIGTEGAGLNSFDQTTGKFTLYTNNPNDSLSLSYNRILSIFEDSRKRLWIGTAGGGINLFDRKTKTFKRFTSRNGLINNTICSMCEDKNGHLWIATTEGLSRFDPKTERFLNFDASDGLPITEFNKDAVYVDERGKIYLGGINGYFCFDPAQLSENKHKPNLVITNFTVLNKHWALQQDISYTKEIILSYREYFFSFEFSALDFYNPHKNKYAYKMEGFNKDWVYTGNDRSVTFTNLDPGEYIFRVKGSGNHGSWSDKEVSVKIIITPPFWRTKWFYFLVLTISVMSIYLYIKWREQKLKAEKKVLEHKVMERTAEVVHQKEIIEEKHKEITDSINYARRIQRSLLASENLLKENLNEHFIVFQPKDVVSGDFYWAGKLSNGDFALVTADSTGHGVPGAIMSMLNISCLEKSVEAEELSEPADILNHTRKRIIITLAKDGSPEGGRDGMDCSVLVLDKNKTYIKFSMANNGVWLARDNKLIEYKADKMPVGKHDKQNIPFTQHVLQLQKGDIIYTFTDGFADQFGGPEGKKFKAARLKELLSRINIKSMEEQANDIGRAFVKWKGNNEQVDDMCIIGVKI